MEKLTKRALAVYDWCVGLIHGNSQIAFWGWVLSLAVVWWS
jgi:hypothetical protein